ncbi:MAG: nicotinate phosphoribosyltransferase [Chloroflexi bacterium]|nr:nicotinate phosphoribosyltransferase [Chloroflexota bacterium]
MNRASELPESPGSGLALFTDLYQLTTGQSYFCERMHEPATFSLFVRHLPPNWGYLVAAGLDDVLSYLESLAFEPHDLAYLRQTGRFADDYLDFLAQLRFTGAVRALSEGTLFFPHEPVVEVTAPVIEAQLVETFIVNQVHFQSIIATKAARCVEAAPGRTVVDFSLRRTHGTDAGMKVARASYLSGCQSTSNVLAGARYGIPIAGTMAHSYIQSFPDELSAFRAYARAYPDACLLLIDTYDTVAGARRAAIVGRELAAAGHRLRGVRLDSGDMAALSREVRRILDEAGLADALIFASGGLDEHEMAQLLAAGAPIDAFGVGSKLGVSADAPYLDMAYKLVAYAGTPRLKLSAAKATWPDRKQVWRRVESERFREDVIALADEPGPAGALPLLQQVMRDGRRLHRESLDEARRRALAQRAALPAEVRRITQPARYPVAFSAALQALRASVAAQAGGLAEQR